jgi:GTP-binding protein Era
MENFENQTDSYKAGFVAVMGRPNVGKSTLINALLGQKIAAVSARPQTTRKRQLGILTLETAQIVLIDTPGVHKALHKLGENMNKQAAETLEESDLILFLVDSSQAPHPEDVLLSKLLEQVKRHAPVILVLNKADLLDSARLPTQLNAYQPLAPGAVPIAISATGQQNLQTLLDLILDLLPEGEPFFPPDQVTDLFEREISADLIRESALIILRDEVPHGIAVRIDQFQERGETGAYIEATLFVERESHKPIVIGEKGQMLKRIGTQSREKIEQMTGRKVFLQLKVKVRKNWRDDEQVLGWFGY